MSMHSPQPVPARQLTAASPPFRAPRSRRQAHADPAAALPLTNLPMPPPPPPPPWTRLPPWKLQSFAPLVMPGSQTPYSTHPVTCIRGIGTNIYCLMALIRPTYRLTKDQAHFTATFYDVATWPPLAPLALSAVVTLMT